MEIEKFLSDLNPQQKEAILTENKRVLVIAGAGSGKTKTLIQKIVYLNKYKHVDTSNILAITFTKNAANEMLDRYIGYFDNQYMSIITNKQITEKQKESTRKEYLDKYPVIKKMDIKTFHSLGYKILHNHIATHFDDQFKIVPEQAPLDKEDVGTLTEDTKTQLVREAFFRCFSNSDFRINVKRYLWNYVISKELLSEFNQDKRVAKFATLSGTFVRSYPERDIANWLTENNIKFQYDKPIDWLEPKQSFNPDFYLSDLDIYLEIWEFKNQAYLTERKRKVQLYEQNHKKLIQLTSEEIYEENFPNAEKKLKKELADLSQNYTFLDDKNPETLEQDIILYKKGFDYLIEYFEEIIDKIKTHDIQINLIEKRLESEEHKRTKKFYNLLLQVYTEYQQLLKEKSYLDFNDLILKTIEILETRPDVRRKYQSKYKYLLVDEYQDVNDLQVRFLKLLLQDDANLFCVGDDWQSIYGFRGSNVTHIVDFEKQFPDSDIIKLLINYRSGEAIVNYSSHVIKQNKKKIEKEIKALNKSLQKIILKTNEKLDESCIYVSGICDNLLNDHAYTPDDIMFLYRRTKDYEPYKIFFQDKGLKFKAQTIHSAKGLEAKAVFLIMKEHFPTVFDDARILQILFPINSEDEKNERLTEKMEEERRVYYVALTRAKERLFILTEKDKTSEFLKDIPQDFFENDEYILYQKEDGKMKICPACEKQISEQYNFCPFCYR